MRAKITLFTLFILYASFCRSEISGEISAQQAYQQGNFSQAIELWQQAEPSFKHKLNLADAYQHLGHYAQAEHILMTLDEQDLDSQQQLLLRQAQAVLALAQGKLTQSQTRLDEAFEISPQVKNPSIRAQLFNQQGNIYQLKLAYIQAGQAYQQALDYLKNSANPLLKAKIQLNYLRNLVVENKKDIAAVWQTTRAAWQICAPSYSKVMALLYLGELRQDENTLKYALQVAEQIHNPSAKAYANGMLAEYYAQQGIEKKALSFIHRALFFTQQDPLATRSYRWYRQLGLLLKAQPVMQLQAYRQAVEALQKYWYSEAHQGYRNTQSGFKRFVMPVYLEFAALLLRKADTLQDEKKQPVLQEVYNWLRDLNA